MKLYPITKDTPYVRGVVGADIPLTLKQRLSILFHSGIQMFFVSDKLGKEQERTRNEYEDAITQLVCYALKDLTLEEFRKMVLDLQLVIRDPENEEADSFPVELE